MDRLRLRRAARWARGEAPWSRLRLGRLGVVTPFEGLAWLYLLALLLVAAGFRIVGDRWWLGTLMLFSGRWPWLVPLAPLAAVALPWRRRALLPLALGLAVGLWGIMGLTLGLRARVLGAARAQGPRLRVLTYNADGGEIVALHLGELVARWQPDLMAFQECGYALQDSLRALPGYHVRTDSSCVASRWPITAMAAMPKDAIVAAGGSGLVVRYVIDAPGGPLSLTNVHLETPRHGLEFLFTEPGEAPARIAANTELRRIESRLARRWVDSAPAPRLVAGDFNTPLESAIYRRYWGDLEEGFDAAGLGFGFTRINGWIRVRIDHVLSDGPWRAASAVVGPDYGSDHLPLIVDYVGPRGAAVPQGGDKRE